MPFSNSSFGFYLDSGLTSAFGGTIALVEKTDLSDNPKDTTLYIGSILSGRQLQASSNPGVDNIVLTPTDTLPNWIASTSYISGQKVQPIAGNGFVYVCTNTGTSGSSAPTWPTSPIGQTVTDGSCVWTLYAVHHPITEMKLALSSGGLASATGGAPLNVATTILGGGTGIIPIYIRITNTVTTVSNSTGNPEIGIAINPCIESSIT